MASPELLPGITRLQILNEINFKAKNYFGVKLESGSLLRGSQYLDFSGKDNSGNLLNEGKDTVPAPQQIFGSNDSIMSD